MKYNIDKMDLIKKGLLKNQCAICGLGIEWQNKELILILDYINGIQTDERIENLRLLCPNCNSQQYNPIIKDNRIKKSNPKQPCKRCGMPASVNTDSNLCKKCASILNRKVEWPTVDQLSEDIKKMSWKSVGIKYNVSDNTIRRWAKQYGLLKG